MAYDKRYEKFLKRLNTVIKLFMICFVVGLLPIVVILFTEPDQGYSWPFILAIGSSVAAVVVYIVRKRQKNLRGK